MATVTYDGQSFIVDSKRIWLVSGAIHYSRIPRQQWRDRIRAAKQAGLNCIETYVFWNLHEPQPGTFRFDGDYDLHHFIELIHEEGLLCIVRPGPYVCSEWDFGGLPAWLHETPNIKLRQGDPQYLQAVSRYLNAVIKQIADLQVTNDGPILLVQNENEWVCHHDTAADAYLAVITRYLREAGVSVPIINCNNLWQPVDGTIDCWNGWSDLLANARQLRMVQPDAPRLITELWTGWFDTWGKTHQASKTPQQVMRKLCEVAATGAQYNLYMFHGGTNFGFSGGRTLGNDQMFMTTSYDYDAPLLEAGGRGAKYFAVKRINTFLSQFANLMAHLKPTDQSAVASSSISVIHQSGSQGDTLFVTKPDDCKTKLTDVILPDGRHMTIHFGHELAAWTVLNANLNGVATLNLTNLRPWAFTNNRMLVLYGPANTHGVISINHAVLNITVPSGKSPVIEQHENLTVVVLNEKMIDAAYLHKDGNLYMGIGGFDNNETPVPIDGASTYNIIDSEGKKSRRQFATSITKSTSPRLGQWQWSSTSEYTDGSAMRFAAIKEPRSLETCGADFGYGWYRLKWKNSKTKKVNLMIPQSADRIHLYLNGKFKSIIGFGPGSHSTNDPLPLSIPNGQAELVALADNLGRFNYGTHLGESKGLFGHLLDVKPIKLTKPQQTIEPTPNAFELTNYISNGRFGDASPRPRYTWTFNLKTKSQLVLVIKGNRSHGVILINGEPVSFDNASGVSTRLVISPEQLKRGNNTLTLAPIDDVDDIKLTSLVTLYQVVTVISQKANWAYARWRMPDDEQFTTLPKKLADQPAWFKTTFKVKQVNCPLWLNIQGLTKGQVYLNGRNVGRYFVATPEGKKVPPQSQYYLPEAWLKVGEPNELVLFDEHGKVPMKCKLGYDAIGPYHG